jgi:hypothetical protein
MCPIPNGFRDKVVSLYDSKIIDKKEILHTFSNKAIPVKGREAHRVVRRRGSHIFSRQSVDRWQ